MANRVSLLMLSLLLLFFVKVGGQVHTGAEQFSRYLPLLNGKRVGIVANRASVVEGSNTLDTLLALGVNVKALFCPEHGFRTFAGAGDKVMSSVDSLTGLPVISLYGNHRKPTPEDLRGMDVMLFDLQDVGVRFYTYISTLTYAMEACAEAGIPLIVLDRPNPNGFYVDGPILEPELSSFVGLHPVPVVYGMSIGEYARMVNGEGWMKGGVVCDLTVIPLEGWNHSTYEELPVPPSPNLPTANAIYLYPSLCFFEGTSVSIGRGTPFPFEVFGHPVFKGFSFFFIPEPIPGKSLHPPQEGNVCYGLDLRDFYAQHPGLFGRINLAWLMMAFRMLNYDPVIFTPFFDTLAGTRTLRKQIIEEVPESEIRAGWQEGIARFKVIREKYLLYD